MTLALPLLLALTATPAWSDRCRAHADELTELAARADAGDSAARLAIAGAARLAEQDLSAPEGDVTPRLPALARTTSDDDVAAHARQMARSISASCALAATAPTPTEPARMKAILARPEFDRAHAGSTWIARLAAAALEALRNLLGSDGVVEAAAILRPMILVGVALLVLYLGLRISRSRRAQAPPGRASNRPEVVTLEEPDVLRARGDAALAEGRLRDAVRAHLLALLAALERASLLRPGRTRTNRECARDLASRGAPLPLVHSFTALADAYDLAFYGKDSMEAGEAAALVQAARSLARELP